VAIPSLTASGLLPEGIHRATLDELQARFGSTGEARIESYTKLLLFLQLVRSFGMFTSIVIDGSFVTDKPAPSDIDAVLILPGAGLKQLAGHPDYYKLDNVEIKESFNIDLYIDPDLDGMARFFQQLKTEDALQRGVAARHLRGVVEVVL
jgi:hypothetical protein